jgi:hypothetical protein
MNMPRRILVLSAGIFVALSVIDLSAAPLTPVIKEPWIQITGDPDLGDLTNPKQQPVDFAIWQAADGTWQVLECIRGTKETGETRLLYRWEGKKLTDASWTPVEIAMRADPALGETSGGLQAPYVFREADTFQMMYGDWNHICRATSADGKHFTRVIQADEQAGLFGEGGGANTRDPMVLKIGATYFCYYAAYPGGKCSVFCRTSTDLQKWSDPRQVAFGGSAGEGKFSAECPFVVQTGAQDFYLFRTQHYGKSAQTNVYFSHDPMDFGVSHDEGHFVCTLPIAAPEILKVEGRDYIAVLLPDLKGIQIAQLDWQAAK